MSRTISAGERPSPRVRQARGHDRIGRTVEPEWTRHSDQESNALISQGLNGTILADGPYDDGMIVSRVFCRLAD